MVLGSKVRFLLIVFKANLKASSSAPEGPLSKDSNIPPGEREGGGDSKEHQVTEEHALEFYQFSSRSQAVTGS